MQGSLKELRVIAGVSELSIAKLLDVSDQAKLLAAADRYKILKAGSIEEIWYQTKIVDEASREKSGRYGYQLPPGAGKTYPSADISIRFQKHGKTIYVCPNTAAMGDESSGIIQKFHRMYHKRRVKARIGRVNETSKTNDVHFFTPGGLIGLRRLQPSLFEQLIDEAALLVVDEAHHFPIEDDGAHKVFGEIEKIAQSHFISKGKKLVAFTATYGRLDGRPPIIPSPDFMLTVQDAVNDGRCPEIHGQQIFLPFKCPKATRSAQDFDLQLEGEEYEDYWRTIAGCMVEIYRRNPAPFAAFVRLQSEADYLAEVFNHSSGLGRRGVAVMTARTMMSERMKIIERINDGALAGYVTCGVGEEAIDIPKIEVIHFIKRTQSVNKLVQAVGRALRIHKDKKRALFVDYQVMKETVIQACNGIFLYAKACGIDRDVMKTRPNGGAIVAIDGARSALIPGAETFGEVEDLVVRKLLWETSANYRRMELLVKLAASGEPRPTDKTTGEYEGESLVLMGRLYYRLNNPKNREYDPDYLKRIHTLPNLHPSWKGLMRERMREREEELFRRGAAGEPKPKWKSDLHELAFSLQAWTNKNGPKYKPEFHAKMLKIAPKWFEPDPAVQKIAYEPEYIGKPEPTPEVTPIPKGHWMETGFWVDATRSFLSRDKTHVQPVILAALKAGIDLDSNYSPRDPRAYFVEKIAGAWPAMLAGSESQLHWKRNFRASPGSYDVPYAWALPDLQQGIQGYTDRNSIGAGRRYDLDFSYFVRLRFPENPNICSILSARRLKDGVRAYGLSPWEKDLKYQQDCFFKNFRKFSPQERQQRFLKFALLDSEFIHAVDSEVGSVKSGYGQEYGFVDKEICNEMEALLDELPKETQYRKGGRGLYENVFERLANDIYYVLTFKMEKADIAACGGYDVVDAAIQSLLMTGNRGLESNFKIGQFIANDRSAKYVLLRKAISDINHMVKDPSILSPQRIHRVMAML